MSYTAICSVKGSPGATTTAFALARHLAASGNEVILADCDRFGGSIGPALELPGMPSVRQMAAQVLHHADPSVVRRYAHLAADRFWVLVGITSLEQAVALEHAWPHVADSLAAVNDARVIVDAGRLPESRSGPGALVRVAQRLLVVTRATPVAAVFLNAWSTALRGLGPRCELVVVDPPKQADVDELARTSGFDIAAVIPGMTVSFELGRAAFIPTKGPYDQAIRTLARSLL